MNEFIEQCQGNDFNRLTLLEIGETIDRIYRKYGTLPTVDAVEVVHGQWIVDGSGVVICSECGAEHEWIDYRSTFCEDCGAKMDGETNPWQSSTY